MGKSSVVLLRAKMQLPGPSRGLVLLVLLVVLGAKGGEGR